MFKKTFSFKGRIERIEYLLSFLIALSLYSIIDIVIAGSHDGMRVLGFLNIPILWFFFAQGAKRCHDTGRNGLWQLIPFFWIILIIAKGDVRDNRYGDRAEVANLH